MEIHEILGEYVKKDYYTANIKAEVILDTILTPVLDKVLTVVGEKNKNKGINGEMRLLAKEFPMLKNGGLNYRNCNVDYLMCDEKSVYFVELKTTQESFDDKQMCKYVKYLKDYIEGKTFADTAGKDFINLLNSVSKTGYSNENQPWKGTNKDNLKWLFETIVHYSNDKGRTAPPQKKWEEKDRDHVERAIVYLEKEKAVSSKKYLLTAGQMLDHMKDGEWWDCKRLKLLYLMPEKLSEDQIVECYQKNMIVVTFQEIVEQAYVISKEMKMQGLKNYWEWVLELLVQCGLY